MKEMKSLLAQENTLVNKMIKKDFNAVYRSINNISLRQFPAETLQKMYE